MLWEGDKAMKKSFTNSDKALLTVMLQCPTPEVAIGRIRNALCEGGEAFGLQAESLEAKYQNPETYRCLFAEMRDCPSYVTYYRGKTNAGKSDEELAQGLLTLAESGADLCDVMTDYFDPQPGEFSTDPEAVKKQMALIEAIHEKGSQVLMSTHVMKFIPAERVLQIALEQQRRGADVVKIVTGADTPEQQAEPFPSPQQESRHHSSLHTKHSFFWYPDRWSYSVLSGYTDHYNAIHQERLSPPDTLQCLSEA